MPLLAGKYIEFLRGFNNGFWAGIMEYWNDGILGFGLRLGEAIGMLVHWKNLLLTWERKI